MYTDQMYRYAPRATCSRAVPHCGSAYLFCDLRFNPHCVSKIKLNGNCRRFEGLDACFEGKCINGYCTPDFTPKKVHITLLNRTQLPS
ncbi:unnamed protein product [Anisakis simplex]|uniref:EB domain-containing protein n=1 Tax=Anisakis simplex TaxID=6269 RepID=A0A0M3JPS0_ANISI|nr:unnamed protein product [Anisakis simplex]